MITNEDIDRIRRFKGVRVDVLCENAGLCMATYYSCMREGRPFSLKHLQAMAFYLGKDVCLVDRE